MKKFTDINKEYWDGLTEIHEKSKFYDVEGFIKGKSSLNFVELEALGNVKEKSLLHLQCHFGMDTLSWARLGANVTGIDLSDKAVKLARSLNERLKLNAEFISSDIYDLKEKTDKKFDIVFTSYGVTGWLPDLEKWGETISHFLKPGGVFFIAEFHPVVWMFDNDFKYLKYSYFHKAEPIIDENEGSYTGDGKEFKHISYGWNHSLEDVVSSLLNNNLQIESFKEYPFSFYNCFKNAVQSADGFWRIKGYENIIPMMYSLKATKK